MEINTFKFVANVDGSITCDIYNSLGEKQNMVGCYITFNLAYEYEDNAIISLPMTVLENGSTIINLTPVQTSILDNGEYEMNLIIIDSGNKKHVTEKVKISIDRPIE